MPLSQKDFQMAQIISTLKVDMFYLKAPERLWVVRFMDLEGNQIGHSSYFSTRAGAVLQRADLETALGHPTLLKEELLSPTRVDAWARKWVHENLEG